MEIVIGFRETTRDLILETDASVEELRTLVDASLGGEGKPLRIIAKKNREVTIPADAIAFVEIREQDTRRVGFGL
ncbi:DUF3107 domain-containing protein [Actinotignum sanguinis]|uniref:ATP-binding protein n=3 Tax=Actinomycetaceae TaxID=2049 RepID=S2VJE3_9ACTO|nr:MULTISPECIES: DUF3107 domain-containing protein [Actinotignum]WPJ89838.1 DUF3107 domain-containing protein [Schaalia turicensis]EPD26100.1 hypothetical protein HMPREF9237_01375 [Actinotignum schaalii FB123-CNA-2]MDE1553120.1 DUF3107 domain-containing protein [Actinotignum sanguinis]MDE1565636.1 DUF3107 domain-containing protein [Actinotignum sanguinis]MDE1576893.1 DUF3107 domain-containing protein [Actinotignum sanguinis]